MSAKFILVAASLFLKCLGDITLGQWFPKLWLSKESWKPAREATESSWKTHCPIECTGHNLYDGEPQWRATANSSVGQGSHQLKKFVNHSFRGRTAIKTATLIGNNHFPSNLNALKWDDPWVWWGENGGHQEAFPRIHFAAPAATTIYVVKNRRKPLKTNN